MPAYCKKRTELFTISAFLGGAVSTVIFRYHGDQIASYFDLVALHRYLIAFLITAYLLPPLIFYSLLRPLNGLLVRFLGKPVLDLQRKTILKKLVEASLSNQALYADPTDLVEEVAWESLAEYWRPE